MTEASSRKLSVWQSVRAVTGSWRLAAVTLMSFSSGLPLGLVWIAIPTWMTRAGVDIKVVGLFTLAQAPWSFKFLWSPLMDRYPLPWLGRKRGWILLSQFALLVLGLCLAGAKGDASEVWLVGVIALGTALASATQDIALDAYAVEVLRPEEHGLAVGARTALYRAGMFVSGGLAITLASNVDIVAWGAPLLRWEGSWSRVNVLLALFYLPSMLVTWRAPEPEVSPQPPRSLREAAWGPFLGMLGRSRALEILAFVVLFKLADNLTQALTRPFLVQVGFNDVDVGVATATIGLAAAIVGTFLGGLLSDAVGLGPALWISGLLQIVSNLGYAVVAQVGVNRPVMYAAQAFELGTSGLGSGAFGVLLLRLTQKRFSATQYALLSSLFSIPRVLAGPPAGLLADALGWRDFFVLTLAAGIPGLVMLGRFVPWGQREPRLDLPAPPRAGKMTGAGIAARAALAAGISWLVALLLMAAIGGIKVYRAGGSFDLAGHLWPLLVPQDAGGWLTAAGISFTALMAGLLTAAALAARQHATPFER